MPAYAELQVTTNFSFLRGGSHPEEMVRRAAELGHAAVAVTDRNSLAGVVRAHTAAKEAGIKLLVGARIDLVDGWSLLLFPRGKPAYERLSRLITLGRRRAPKGECELRLDDLPDYAEGQIAIALPPEKLRDLPGPPFEACPAQGRARTSGRAEFLQAKAHPEERAERASKDVEEDPDKALHPEEPPAGAESPCIPVSPPPRPSPFKGEGDVSRPASSSPLPAGGEGGARSPRSGEREGEGDKAPPFPAFLARLKAIFGAETYLAARWLYRGDDDRRLSRLAALAEAQDTPLVACNDVHYHVPERRPLQDVVTCIREHCTLEEAGFRLFPNAERHLKPAEEMARLFARYPEAVARTAEIADKIVFSLDELRYVYPVDPAPEGRTPQEELERLARAGAAERYPGGVPKKVQETLEHELALIGQLGYAPYFLTVHDIVRFARSQNILCQGRGSAANSAVCYCLGITAVDPGTTDLLFERFVSAERNEPPDIDVDFEHERREEVIQYVYQKYGRDRAGLAATVICYRARSAIREVGKVLGLSEDLVGTLAKTVWGWSSRGIDPEAAQEHGIDPDDPTVARAIALASELAGFPRHLSQHVGGFVITKGLLSELAPIENAAMEDRTVLEWDKDDLDALGILKIDILGLGMLSCIRKGFELLARHYGRHYDLATVPPEDPAVYDMLCEADSVGVFQVESRAQMSMLPRLRPREFYDLVIEVAIVRPGPIQGDMVHPYLRRRNGEEAVAYPSEDLEKVLGKTLGVPLFQEQAMKIAIVAAGFTPSEADRLRRAMATFRKTGQIHGFHEKMVEGMVARGYDPEFAERCFRQIEGFGEYGFPESHAASFALLVYVSAWLKRHYPAAFACALLNSQPMGFYAPAQIVRDARDHGVEVLPPDVNRSGWDNSLEPGSDGAMALRLGFRQVKGLREEAAERLVAARGNGYADPRTLWRKSGLGPKVLERLAEADAFRSMGLDRREALWAVRPLGAAPLPLFQAMDESEQGPEPETELPEMRLGEHVAEDYRFLRLSLKAHPLALLRDEMAARRAVPCETLLSAENGSRVEIAGLVTARQRPGTAKGVIFMTLEDETGPANVIVWPHVLEKYRKVVVGARLVHVTGELQREGIVTHLIAHRLTDLSSLLDELCEREAPFENALARADEVTRNTRNSREKAKIAAPGKPRLETLYPSRDFH